MPERTLAEALKKKLINNEAFTYAHLIKFERPSSVLKSGKYSTDAKRYAYFTDASVNISFDDQSLNTDGGSNGAQEYIANKVLSVGSYSETIQAKATGMTLKLSAESLGVSLASTSISTTSTTVTLATGTGLRFDTAGFREGDKIKISGITDNPEVRITGIGTDGRVLQIAAIDTPVVTTSAGSSITITQASDEIKGPLVEVNDSALKSFINREIFIYKAFLDPETQTTVGASVLIFKGIITGCDITEDPAKDITVNWKLTSHWGDFAAVKGRITDDSVHRALNAEGRSQPDAALKPEYASDLGFLHSQETVNMLATYTAIEKEQRIKVKKKWGGLKTKVKTYEVDVEVERDANLAFELSAKFLPVVYGVQKISAKPVFVDTKSNDPNNIFIVYALCEGEIAGIYDLYVEGNPTICLNKEDSDDRNFSSGTSREKIEVLCKGRADRGDVIGSQSRASGTNRAYEYGDSYAGSGPNGYDYDGDYESRRYGYYEDVAANTSSGNSSALTESSGTLGALHEQVIKLTSPNNIVLDVHTGKSDQQANNALVQIAVSPGFKRQQDYYTGREEYWSPNHRLLDTAYVMMDCEIGQDATTVPEIEYIVRGKLIECYNYDYSYYSPSTNHAEYNVGDTVTLKKTSDNSTLNSNVIIIDKWEFKDENGTDRYRFRFSEAPSLGYTNGVPTVTSFYMTKSGASNYTMLTFNHEEHTGTVPSTLTQTVTSTSTTTVSGTSKVDLNFTGGYATWVNKKLWGGLKRHLIVRKANGGADEQYYGMTLTGEPVGSNVIRLDGNSTGYNTTTTTTVTSADQIQLASGASSSDDAYNGLEIELTKTSTNTEGATEKQIFKRTIADYDGTTKIATVGEPWVEEGFPEAGDTYKVLQDNAIKDRRVSINPAIQLLDYMSAKTYGKDLDINVDISLADFLLAARTCDSRGTQTVTLSSSASVTAGDRYVLTSDGAAPSNSNSIIWMGRVKTSSSGTSVVFEECFGKPTKSFMNGSHNYQVGDMIYGRGGYFRVSSAGYITSEPTYNLTNYPIYKLGTSSSISLGRQAQSGTTGGYINPVDYSLYDADFVKYWRYLGWDDHHQRYVTRHQCNGVVDTATSVFSNIQGFLTQFNGMLSFEAGKYVLRIQTETDTISSTKVTSANASSHSGYTKGVEKNPRYIREEDIIGQLRITDPGPSKSFNTVSGSVIDPANKFNGRSVSFYDSSYLQADKNVIKSGNLSQPAISNYFNARINVENYLRKSRFGMKVSFKMGPKSLLLLAGDTIAIEHDRFFGELTNPKIFRITNINFNEDCTANITAEEYDDSFYTISSPRLPSVLSQDQRSGIVASPNAPSALQATAGAVGVISLSWSNASGLSRSSMFTEIWVHPTNDENARTFLTAVDGDGTTFDHAVGQDGVQRFYWVRHGKRVIVTSGGRNTVKTVFSGFSATASATTVIPSSLYDVILSADSQTFQRAADGAITGPSNIVFSATRHNLSASPVFTAVSNSGTAVTLTGSGDSRTLSSTNMGSHTSVQVTATVTSTTAERNAGADNTYSDTTTVVTVDQGATGATGATGNTGPRTVVARLNFQSSSSSAPTAPNSSNTNTFNFSTASFSNIASGWAHSTPTYASGNQNKYWYIDITVVESSFGGSQTLSFGTVTQAIGFSGLVTFSGSSTLTDGSTSFSPIIASQVNENVTSINGSVIQTGTIAAARISISGKNVSDLNNDSGFTSFGASNVQDAITNNVTSISGSKITTGTIDASQVTVSNLNAGNITAGSLNVDRITANSLDIASKASSGSIGTINGTSIATATIYEYGELYTPAWNTTGRRHIADTTQTTGSDSGESGSIPAITADSSILGLSPIMTFTFTTHDWGSGTRKHLFLFAGNISGSTASTSGDTEGALAFVAKATSSATDYTSTSGYLFSTGKTMRGATAVIGSQVLSEQADLSPNTQYYVWLFGGVDDISNESLYDSSITVLGLNK